MFLRCTKETNGIFSLNGDVARFSRNASSAHLHDLACVSRGQGGGLTRSVRLGVCFAGAAAHAGEAGFRAAIGRLPVLWRGRFMNFIFIGK